MALGKFDGVDSANIGKVSDSIVSSPAVFELPTGGILTVCGGSLPYNSIDGNLSTQWGSANESPHGWWVYDYGVGYSKKFTGYRAYYFGDASWQYLKAYISTDGTNWTELDSRPGPTGNTWFEATFACASGGRYIKLEGEYGMYVKEFQIRME